MDPPEKRVIISSVYHKGKLVSQDITVPSDKDVDAIKVAAEIHSIFTNELVCNLKMLQIFLKL